MNYRLFFFVCCLLAVGLNAGADIIINEIHYHPQEDDRNGEFIELYNTSDQPVNVSDWRFDEAVNYRLPLGTIIEANGYLVVCRNEFYLRDLYNMDDSIKTVGNFAPSQLANEGETLFLYNADGLEIDRVEYNDASPWPLKADGQGSSLELMHPLSDNNQPLYWRDSSAPTPGQSNSQFVGNTPPLFKEINQNPNAPTANESVNVTVRFENMDAIQNVLLTYMPVGEIAATVTMNRSGNGFIGTLPAQSSGTVVSYFITASNQDGFTLTVPVGTGRRFLYQVDAAPVQRGDLVINEIMYNPPDNDADGREWIELFNPGEQTLDLSYWIIKDQDDDHELRIPPGTTIDPKGFLLIANTKAPEWETQTIPGMSFSLGNGGDEVRVMNPNGIIVAAVEYNDNSEWPWGADGEGGSLELLQVSRPNHEPNNWGVSPNGGTPGQPNARAIMDEFYHDYDIVFNELFYHPDDEEYDNNIEKEYIELHNRGTQPVDISGWFFSNGIEYRFPEETVIEANGYLLVCKNTERYLQVDNKIGNYQLRLSNGGETLALTNDQGIVIDYIDYVDELPWPVLADGEGNSMELINPFADNSSGQYWYGGNPSSPGVENTARVENIPPRISRVKHSPEFPVAAESEDKTETITVVEVGETWRYLKGRNEPPANWNEVDFDASDWDSGPTGIGYSDGDDATVLNDMRYNYFSVYIRKEFTLDSVENFDVMQFQMDYDDSFVAYLNGVEIARANVSGSPPRHDTFADSNHEAGSMEFFDVSEHIEILHEGTNVLTIQGHNVNESSSDFSLIPQLELQRVIPAQDEGSDQIKITARVRDEDGLEAVYLHYQRLSAPFGTGLVLGEWKQVPMVDDGTAGDEHANDQYYTAILNYAEKIHPREVWRYRISAIDLQGNESTLPRQNELTRNFAFFVENSLDKPEYPTVYIFMERSVLNWLNQNVQTNDEQRSIVVVDGQVYDLYHEGGVRFRGHTLRNKPKKSWKIQFAKGNRWDGQRDMNLNANYQASPLVRGESGFMEHLAYSMFDQIDFEAAHTDHWRLMLNNDYYGLFLNVEQYNEDFLEQHELPEETRIFKAGVQARRSYMAREPNFESYAQKYEFMMGRDEDIQDLITFIEELNTAEQMKAFFEQHVNIEKYLDYLALVAVLSHVDSTEKNYFPTKGADGRWYIMPWDMSHTWGEIHTNDEFPFIHDYSLLDGADGGVFGINVLRQKFLQIPEFRDRYYQHLRYFVDHIFTRQHLDPIFDSYWNYLKDAIDENVRRWNSPGQIDQMVPEMKAYVSARREFILSELNALSDNTPTMAENLFPAEDELVGTRELTLRVSSLDGNAGDEGMTQWEIQKENRDFFQPLWSGESNQLVDAMDIPATVLSPGETYYWRMRYRLSNGDWSPWTEATSFNTAEQIPPPDVNVIEVTPLDQSARIVWIEPVASDLARVDIFEGSTIVESAKITNNRVRIRDLVNGQEYSFTIRVVDKQGNMSSGVTVRVTPEAPPIDRPLIAYFRFEGNVMDENKVFTHGMLLGDARIELPGAEDPIPLTQEPNTASLLLAGESGNGFQFGSAESTLDRAEQLTLECYALSDTSIDQSRVLIDRYDESNASLDGVWRFGTGLHEPGSLDFFFNDGDTQSGMNGRLHFAALKAVPQDGEFHHYAVVIDLRAPLISEKVKMFIDGREVESVIVHDDGISDYDTLRMNSDLPVLVGASRLANGTAINVFPGRIDEVRLMGEALLPEQFLHPPTETSIENWAVY